MGANVKIDRIEVIPVEYPLRGSFKFFKTAGYRVLLVKITADNGMVGWGQSLPVPTWSYETPETAAIVLREYYAPALLDHDPLDIEGAHAILDRAIAASFSVGMPLTRRDRPGFARPGRQAAGQVATGIVGLRTGWPDHLELDNQRPLARCAGRRIRRSRARGYRNFNIKVAPDPQFERRVGPRGPPSGAEWLLVGRCQRRLRSGNGIGGCSETGRRRRRRFGGPGAAQSHQRLPSPQATRRPADHYG